MKLKSFVAVSLVALGLAGSCFVRANAAIVQADYTGTVYSGYDITGLFGTPGASLTGDPFMVTYTVNTADGFYATDIPGEQIIAGGSANQASSPISAVVTINGVSIPISGSYNGVAYAVTDVAYGGPYTLHDAAENFLSGTILTSNYVENYQSTTGNTGITAPLPLTNTNTMGGFFYFSTIDQASGATLVDTFGSYNTVGAVQVFGVSAAPEPGSWALLLLGVAGVGLVMRRTKRKSVCLERVCRIRESGISL